MISLLSIAIGLVSFVALIALVLVLIGFVQAHLNRWATT